MFATILMLALAPLSAAVSKTLAVQICLDRAGYSCNTIDGRWGPKSQSALQAYCADRGLPLPASPEEARDALFPRATNLFHRVAVTKDDLAALVQMPSDPSAKAALDRMGYATIQEMFAERGHLSRRALERWNPRVDWAHVAPGTQILIPRFPSMEEELSAWPRNRPSAPPRPTAALIRISLSRFEITVQGANGRTLARFPCSIARDKAKLPPQGELKVVTRIARPNYTYTPDPSAASRSRHVWPPGPRNPVGVAWLGLNLPGYGIHGTPHPESVGNAESHGCFRLANWNAARLYALCPLGARVIIEP